METKYTRRVRAWMQKGIFEALTIAGVSEEAISKYLNPAKLDEFSTNLIVPFLKELVDPSQKLIAHVNLHSPEQWRNLELRHAYVAYPEVTLLRRMKKEMRKLWNARPRT